MPYVTPIYDRDEIAPEEAAMFDRVLERQNVLSWVGRPPDEAVGPYFGLLLQSPRVADLLSALGMFYRSRGETRTSYAHADREWIDIVLGTELGSNAVVYSHIPDAVALGVRPEAIKAFREGRDDDLTEGERELADFIRMVISGTVTLEAYAGIEARFGMRGALEYTTCITWLLLTTRNLQAMGFGDPTDVQVADVVRQVVDGTAELPDPRKRVPPIEAADI